MRFAKHTGAITLCLLATPAIKAQSTPGTIASDDPDRQRAFQVYGQHKMPEAVPLLETVVARYPTDTAAHEALGVALVSLAGTESDPAKEKADRLYARRELLRAKDLGDTSDLSRILLAEIPENGDEGRFAEKSDLDAALREGEAAFSRGDWPSAIAGYSRAWGLDSTHPAAALYLGDAYFRMKDMDRAGQWFAKAIQVAPNQEVAYRYWGDALLAQGKMREARAKYMEGIAADPYRASSLVGLHNWLSANNLTMRKPPVELPAAPQLEANGKIDVSIGGDIFGKNAAGPVWLIYSLERVIWQKEKFRVEFPNEKTYRHSLKEETSALSMAISAYRQQTGKNPRQRDESLERLVKLGDEGMIESFALLSHPDAQIARDYSAYRESHRDKLIGYLDEYLVPPAP